MDSHRDIIDVCDALGQLFPDTMWDCSMSTDGRTLEARTEDSFTLRFQDLPRVAEILGTERIDFRHEAVDLGDESWGPVDEGGFFKFVARYEGGVT